MTFFPDLKHPSAGIGRFISSSLVPSTGLAASTAKARSLSRCALLALALAAGLALHLWLSSRLPIEGDEAIVGLMARHILSGERPVFYYGQSYMGALEAYLVALSFAVGGVSVASMRLVPILSAFAFAVFTYVLGKRFYGREAGLIACLYVSLSPLFLSIWSVKVRGGFIESLALGSAQLILLDDLAYRERLEVWRVLLFGFVAGLGFWVNQLFVPYLVVAAAFIVLRLGRRSLRVAFLTLPAFLLGSLPFWVANATTDLETFRELAWMNTGAIPGRFSISRTVKDFVSESVPILLGFVDPGQDIGQLKQQRAAAGLPFWAGSAAGALMVVLAIWSIVESARRGLKSLLVRRDLPILGVGLMASLFLLSSHIAVWLADPHPFLLLYALAPFFAGLLVSLGKRSRPVLVIVLLCVLALNLGRTLTFDVNKAMPVSDSHSIPLDVKPVVSYLLERDDNRIYAGYYILFRLAFESDERIVGGAIYVDLGLFSDMYLNRIPRYVEEIQAAPSPAYVFLQGTASEKAFKSELDVRGVKYTRHEVGGFAVYDMIDPPQHAPLRTTPP